MRTETVTLENLTLAELEELAEKGNSEAAKLLDSVIPKGPICAHIGEKVLTPVQGAKLSSLLGRRS